MITPANALFDSLLAKPAIHREAPVNSGQPNLQGLPQSAGWWDDVKRSLGLFESSQPPLNKPEVSKASSSVEATKALSPLQNWRNDPSKSMRNTWLNLYLARTGKEKKERTPQDLESYAKNVNLFLNPNTAEGKRYLTTYKTVIDNAVKVFTNKQGEGDLNTNPAKLRQFLWEVGAHESSGGKNRRGPKIKNKPGARGVWQVLSSTFESLILKKNDNRKPLIGSKALKLISKATGGKYSTRHDLRHLKPKGIRELLRTNDEVNAVFALAHVIRQSKAWSKRNKIHALGAK